MSNELTVWEDRKRTLETQLDIAEKQARLSELQWAQQESRLVMEAWGDFIDRREYLRDDTTFGPTNFIYPPSSIDDRDDGKFRPIFETESELRMIRGPIRLVCETFGSAINIRTNLTNYTIGEGFSYEVKMKKGFEQQCPKELPHAMQHVLDTFLEDNEWTSNLEHEDHDKSRVDGESPLVLRPGDGWRVIAEHLEPDQITEPSNPGQLEQWLGCADQYVSSWTFGVHSTRRRPGQPLGYHVIYDTRGIDWDYFPASDVALAIRIRSGVLMLGKRNVPTNVKRGISDFYPILPRLRNSEKLGNNLEVSSAIQAAIAYIRSYGQNVNPDQIAALRAAAATRKVNRPQGDGSTRTVLQQDMQAGSIIDTNGAEYKYGPAGQSSAPNFVETIQSSIRYVGSRWSMPEYMISADASNNNFASILVAGSPFVQSRQSDQRRYGSRYKRMAWYVLRFAYEAGFFQKYGAQWDQIESFIEIWVTPPDITIADGLKDAQQKQIERANGVLSARSWIKETGRNVEEEEQNINDEGGQIGQAPNGGGQGGAMGGQGGGMGPDGKPLPGGGQGAQPPGAGNAQTGGEFRESNQLQWKRYISRIQDILTKVAAKEITPTFAAEALASFGVDQQRIQRLIADVMDDGKLTPQNAQDIAEEAAMQAVGRLIMEDAGHDPHAYLEPPNRTLFANDKTWRKAVELWLHQILPLMSPQARAQRFGITEPKIPVTEDCGTGAGGFQAGNTCARGDDGGGSGGAGSSTATADEKKTADSPPSRREKMIADIQKQAETFKFEEGDPGRRTSQPRETDAEIEQRLGQNDRDRMQLAIDSRRDEFVEHEIRDRENDESDRSAIERMSDEDKEKMDEAVTEARDEYVNEHASEFGPDDVDKEAVTEQAGYSNKDIADSVREMVRHDDRLVNAVNRWIDADQDGWANKPVGTAAIDDILGEMKNADPLLNSNVEGQVKAYRAEAEKKINTALDDAAQEMTDEERERYENRFDDEDARHDFVVDWRRDNPREAEDIDRDEIASQFDPESTRHNFLQSWSSSNPPPPKTPAAEPTAGGNLESGGTWYKRSDGDYVYRFNVGPGREFTASALQGYGGPYDLSSREIQFYDDRHDFGVTGKGGGTETFAKVVPAVVALIKHDNPDVITFSASGDKRAEEGKAQGVSRIKLYDRLTSTLLAADPGRSAKVVDTSSFSHPTRYYIIYKNEHKDRVTDYLRQQYAQPATDLVPRGLREHWVDFNLPFDSAWLIEEATWSNAALLEDCGDGAGGFEDGNTCAKGGGGSIESAASIINRAANQYAKPSRVKAWIGNVVTPTTYASVLESAGVGPYTSRREALRQASEHGHAIPTDNLIIRARQLFERLLEDCGTGAGGFQPGNDCAKGDSGAGAGGGLSAGERIKALPPEDREVRTTKDERASLMRQTKARGGVTYDVVHHNSPQKGYVVSTYLPQERSIKESEFTPEHVEKYLEENAHILKADPHAMLGLWHDVDHGNIVLDIVKTVPTQQEAEKLGNEHKQDSVWDIEHEQLITLDKGAAARRATGADSAGSFGSGSGQAGSGVDREGPEVRELAEARKIKPPTGTGDIERFVKEAKASDLFQSLQSKMAAMDKAMPPGVDSAFWSKHANSDEKGYLPARQALHKQILAETLNPKAAVKPGQRPIAVLTLGPPGAGKSTVMKQEMPRFGVEFTTINPDDVKEKLPEYRGWNGNYVHEESTDVANNQILPAAIKARQNVIYDSTGTKFEKMAKIVAAFKRHGYAVHLVDVSVPVHVAVGRAWDRFAKPGGRYIPLEYIPQIGDKPHSTYERLKKLPGVRGWTKVSTDVAQGEHPVIMERGASKNATD